MEQLFLQNVIAIIWDFDKTLIPGYMQEPIFKAYNVDAETFWKEVDGLPRIYRQRGAEIVSKDTVYLNHILTYVRAGKFAGLTNARLQELGGQLKFYPGVPEIFDNAKRWVQMEQEYQKHEIVLENYIVSTGLRQMILGSAVASKIDGVWACEFVEGSPGPGYLSDQAELDLASSREISDIAYAIDNTSKTRAVFEINKGSNKVAEIDVNATIAHELRRIPFENMIYVADGPSDIPVFSIINRFRGRTFAVYPKGGEREFVQVNDLQNQDRVQAIGEADYSEGSHTYLWLKDTVRQIAEKIVERRKRAVGEQTGRPPGHII